MKTEAGLQAMKDRSIALSPRQRSAFILFDGKRTLDGVLQATAAVGVSRDDIEQLVGFGLLADAERASADTVPMGLMELPAPAPGSRPPVRRFADAHPLALELTSGLGARGATLFAAVQEARTYAQLLALAPRIREAAGAERYLPLGLALHDT